MVIQGMDAEAYAEELEDTNNGQETETIEIEIPEESEAESSESSGSDKSDKSSEDEESSESEMEEEEDEEVFGLGILDVEGEVDQTLKAPEEPHMDYALEVIEDWDD